MIFIIIAGVLVTLILSLIVFVNVAPQFGGKPSSEHIHRYSASPHFRNGLFRNLVETPMHSPDLPFHEAIFEYVAGGVERVPSVTIPFQKVDLDVFNNDDSTGVHITWLGHSSLLIQFEGLTFLTDPMFGQRAAPVSFLGPKRFNPELPLDPADIPHLDAIILSHDHYDHLDYKTIKALHHKTDKFFVPLGVALHLWRWGVEPDKIVELDWWDSFQISTIELVATPTRHFSGRRGNDRGKTLWVSWVIKSDTHRLYFGGDSGYGNHFKEIGEKYGPFDLTMLENGAYNTAWPYVHMIPEQTAQAHLDLNGEVLLPIHWAQFNLSLHPWREPIERITTAAEKHHIKLATPKIGERFTLGDSIPSISWWRAL